jgi:hypothetical protein
MVFESDLTAAPRLQKEWQTASVREEGRITEPNLRGLAIDATTALPTGQ